MRMNAVLSNPKHPEYGQFTVPLPIPHNQYDGIMEALNAMDMGDPLARDCQMDEILGEYPILKRLEGKPVNIDELDYLAKRLDSFCCALEDAQFQGAAVSYDYSDMADLINLTFSCQEVTVITDFSDLEQVGREHFMVLNGGCASKEELDNLDGYETALLLIDEGDGVVTPYGVVYDNGMCLSQVYDGRHFPQYFYEPPLLTLTVQESKGAPQTWLYLPAPDLQIKRSLIRAGIVDPADMELSFQASEFPDAVDCVLDMESESLEELNKLCRSIQQLSTDEIKKLGAVVEYAQPETAAQVRQLAENLEQFDYGSSEKGIVSEMLPVLRPASIEEAGLFYSQLDETKDAALGTVGHVRIDFGHGGKEFWHSWWPHNEDQFNTPEFKKAIQTVVDALQRDGPLKDLSTMRSYCQQHGGAITADGENFGYIAETEQYQFCLRCTPVPGHYQGYLYCYDKRQQEMAQQDTVVGRVSYADGTRQEFTDAAQYLQTIQEELPYRNTTGFRYEALTKDPQVRKAVDDIILDFAGEANPKRTCNYGMTEKGLQALRDAADPSLPHTYAWFVMTDCNTPQEQLHRGLTLEEAVRLYQDSDCPEKRLGVTKDGIATVDIVRTADGEQNFFSDHQKLDSFKNDPVIFEAVAQLHQELENATCDQSMMM